MKRHNWWITCMGFAVFWLAILIVVGWWPAVILAIGSILLTHAPIGRKSVSSSKRSQIR